MNRLAVSTSPASQSRRGTRLDHETRPTRGAGAAGVSLRPAAMRERDNQAWGDAISSAGSWSLTGRQYLLQNWRADVVLATDSGGSITDRIRYSAYGEPQRYSLCDLVGGGSAGTAPDSVIDADDYTAFINAFGASDALADVNADGVVDGDDSSIFMNVFSAGSDGLAGTGTLSADLDSGFRRGYAGYEFDPVLGASYASVYHVRNRVYDAENGRWNKRDPLGYVDGMGLYQYCKSMSLRFNDPMGLRSLKNPFPDQFYDGPNWTSAAPPPPTNTPCAAELASLRAAEFAAVVAAVAVGLACPFAWTFIMAPGCAMALATLVSTTLSVNAAMLTYRQCMAGTPTQPTTTVPDVAPVPVPGPVPEDPCTLGLANRFPPLGSGRSCKGLGNCMQCCEFQALERNYPFCEDCARERRISSTPCMDAAREIYRQCRSQCNAVYSVVSH